MKVGNGVEKRPLVREAIVSRSLFIRKLRAVVDTSQGTVELEVRAFSNLELWNKLFRRIVDLEGWGKFIEIKMEDIRMW